MALALVSLAPFHRREFAAESPPLLRFAISGRLFVPLEPAAPFFREDMPAAVPHSQLSLFVTLTRKAELERGSLAFL